MSSERPVTDEPVQSIRTPIELRYRYTPGRAASRFLRGMEQGRILGQRCPVCGKVYTPPRGACASDGVATEEEVETRQSADGREAQHRCDAVAGE
jgi:uncharacterized protein